MIASGEDLLVYSSPTSLGASEYRVKARAIKTFNAPLNQCVLARQPLITKVAGTGFRSLIAMATTPSSWQIASMSVTSLHSGTRKRPLYSRAQSTSVLNLVRLVVSILSAQIAGISLDDTKSGQRKLQESIDGAVDLIDVKQGTQPVLIRVRGRRRLYSYQVHAVIVRSICIHAARCRPRRRLYNVGLALCSISAPCSTNGMEPRASSISGAL